MAEGFDPGPVDGVLSWETRQALKNFQESRRLDQNGRLDAPTRAALALTD
jgi:peptidoglycan hydrolase-like protein with peptidoglycan-binding domain